MVSNTAKGLMILGATAIGAVWLGSMAQGGEESGSFSGSGGGYIGGSDDGNFTDVSKSNGQPTIIFESPSFPTDTNSTTQAQPTTKKSSRSALDINRESVFSSGRADGGYSTSWGEVYTKGGQIVGGSSMNASLTAEGVKQQEAKALFTGALTSSSTKKDQKKVPVASSASGGVIYG